MNPEVLVFAPLDDPHAAAVCWALRQNRVNPSLMPSIRADETAKVAIWGDASRLRFEHSASPWSLRGLRSVWYRRPSPPDAGMCAVSDRAFITGQWLRFQNNFMCLADNLLDVLWVNRPEAAVRAENKLLQIQVAHDVGLDVPDLVVSNNVEDVRALLVRWPRIVFKTFYPYNWQSASSGNIYSMSVKVLDRDSELPEAAIAMCPGIYQRYIDKACDIRVTVIGDRYFCVRMRKNDGEAYVDWRNHMYDDDILVEECVLSEAIEYRLRDLMKRLGLVYGCIDLVADHEGNVYFLEVNQAGQFLFLEEVMPGLPLLRAMVAMLAGGRADYSLESVGGCSFSDYRRTDDYARIVQVQVEQQRRLATSGKYHALEA